MGLRDRAAAARTAAAAQTEARTERDRNPEQPWEYRAVWVREGLTEGIAGGNALEAKLNGLGAQGWELVNIISDRAVLKRPAA